MEPQNASTAKVLYIYIYIHVTRDARYELSNDGPSQTPGQDKGNTR